MKTFEKLQLVKKMIAEVVVWLQQTNFTGNLNGNNNRLIFFIFKEAKETTLVFFTRNC